MAASFDGGDVLGRATFAADVESDGFYIYVGSIKVMGLGSRVALTLMV